MKQIPFSRLSRPVSDILLWQPVRANVDTFALSPALPRRVFTPPFLSPELINNAFITLISQTLTQVYARLGIMPQPGRESPSDVFVSVIFSHVPSEHRIADFI